MQYKVSFLLAAFGQFLTAFTSFFGIYFVFERINAVDNFSYEQVLLCFAIVMIAFSIGEMIGGGFAVFPRLLGNGGLDRALVRPRSVILQVLLPNMDFTRLGLLAQAIVVLFIAIPMSGIAWTWQKVATLSLMIACGSTVFFALFLTTAAFSFFTVEATDFLNVFTYGARQFGKYPFSVYGSGVLKFLTFVIPLALFQYYPFLYLIGREHGAFFMISPLFSLLFLIPANLLFRFGLRKFKSTGS
jgi:ABC-2 type transport system permease protein